MTFKDFGKAVGKLLLDVVTNVKGWLDIHKVGGIVFAAVGLAGALRTDPISVQMFLAIETVAGGFFGFSIVDSINALRSGEPPRY